MNPWRLRRRATDVIDDRNRTATRTDEATQTTLGGELSAPVAAVLRRARADADETALIADDEPWSFGALSKHSGRLAAGLSAQGVGHGDRVALHLRNGVEAVLAYLACLRIGAIALPLNTRAAKPELLDLVQRARPVVYIGERELYGRFASVPDVDLPISSRFLIDGHGDGGALPLWAELFGADVEPADVRVAPASPAILLSTSGTTGPSKIVIWSHRTLANLHLSAPGRGIVHGGVIPLITPLMHGAGVYFLLSALTQGAAVVLSPEFEAGAVLDAMQRHRATTVFGLPYLCDALAGEQRARPRDIGSLRTATVAGDACPPEIEDAFEQAFGVPLRSFWAATEDVGAFVTDTAVGPYLRAVEQASTWVVDAAGRSVALGEVGELVVGSPTTSPGYWLGADDMTPMPEGAFRTGDLVREVRPRVFRYVGRTKDLILRGGSNISPAEIESVLRDHPDVVDVGVAGYPDRQLGERVGAVIVLSSTDADAVPGVLTWLAERLAGYKMPDRIAVLDAVPRNALTKIDRAAVAARLRAAKSPD